MAGVPIATGMVLCDYVIIEGKTGKASLIGCFTTIRALQFPVIVAPFSVFASLTDGLGNVTIDLVISQLESGEEISSYSQSVRFPDPLVEVLFHFRLKQQAFPAAGTYQFTLLSEGEWIAQRRLQVLHQEQSHET